MADDQGRAYGSPQKTKHNGKHSRSGQSAHLRSSTLKDRRASWFRADATSRSASCTLSIAARKPTAWRVGHLEHKVSTVDALLVGAVDHDGAVSDKGTDTGSDGRVEVDVALLVACFAGDTCDVTVFAAQVTDLTGFGLGGIAWSLFTADEGVQMSEGLGAVAILGHGLIVNVVDWREKYSVNDRILKQAQRI